MGLFALLGRIKVSKGKGVNLSPNKLRGIPHILVVEGFHSSWLKGQGRATYFYLRAVGRLKSGKSGCSGTFVSGSGLDRAMGQGSGLVVRGSGFQGRGYRVGSRPRTHQSRGSV